MTKWYYLPLEMPAQVAEIKGLPNLQILDRWNIRELLELVIGMQI